MGVLKQGEDCVFSPVKGTYVHLKDVSDATFNSGVLGTGFAVDPEEDVIHAPVEGTISAVSPQDMPLASPRTMVWRCWSISGSIRSGLTERGLRF